MRDVVGWIGHIIHTMFKFDKSKKGNPLTDSLLNNKADDKKDKIE
jgi:hypothetical protein